MKFLTILNFPGGKKPSVLAEVEVRSENRKILECYGGRRSTRDGHRNVSSTYESLVDHRSFHDSDLAGEVSESSLRDVSNVTFHMTLVVPPIEEVAALLLRHLHHDFEDLDVVDDHVSYVRDCPSSARVLRKTNFLFIHASYSSSVSSETNAMKPDPCSQTTGML